VQPILEQAITIKNVVGRPLVWMQLRIANNVAAEAVRQAGVCIHGDKCLMDEYIYLS